MNYTNYSLNFEAPLVEIISAALAQGSVDLPESMPIVESIIYAHANIYDIETKCLDGKLNISATVCFIGVYSDKDGETYSLEAKTSFKHETSYPIIDDTMWADVKGNCEQVECKIVSSRLISVKCVVEITGWAYKKHSISVADVKSDEENSLEVKSKKIAWSSTLIKAFGTSTIRQDIRLGKNEEPIIMILDKSAEFIINKVNVLKGCVEIEGYGKIDILYKHEKGVNKTSHKLDCMIITENPDIIEGKIVCPEVEIKNIDLKIYADELEERSIISVEIPVYAKVYQETMEYKDIVVDAYGIDAPLSLEYIDVELPNPTMIQNQANCQFTSPLTIEGEFEDNNAVCIGDVYVDSIVGNEEGFTVSGNVRCRMWSSDGQHCVNASAIYSVDIPSGDVNGADNISCTAQIAEIDVFNDNDGTWNMRGELFMQLTMKSRQQHTFISSIEFGEKYEKEEYPLIMAMTDDDDTLWSLAQRCKISMETLLTTNPQLKEGIEAGVPVVIYKA